MPPILPGARRIIAMLNWIDKGVHYARVYIYMCVCVCVYVYVCVPIREIFFFADEKPD